MPGTPRGRTIDAAGRAGALALLWAMLAGPDAVTWIIGGPAVLAATAASFALAPARSPRWIPAKVAPFVAWFLRESVVGGIEVARAAWRPSRLVDPGTLEHSTSLTGPELHFFCAVLSLLPGTLAVRAHDGAVLVHALRRQADLAETIADLEARVAALFGVRSRIAAVVPAGGARLP